LRVNPLKNSGKAAFLALSTFLPHYYYWILNAFDLWRLVMELTLTHILHLEIWLYFNYSVLSYNHLFSDKKPEERSILIDHLFTLSGFVRRGARSELSTHAKLITHLFKLE